MAVVCLYFIWALSLLFGQCRLSEFTLAGPQLRQSFDEGVDYKMLKNSSTLDLESHLKLKKKEL